MSYATSDEIITKGLERLAKFCAGPQGLRPRQPPIRFHHGLQRRNPARGRQDLDHSRQARCPGQPGHPLHPGRRHGPGHLGVVRPRPRRLGRQGLRRQAQDLVVRGLRRRGELQALQQLAARRHGRGLQGVHRRDQGPAHDAGRRRHPLAQRRPAPDARPLRVPAPGAVVHRRPVAREAPGARQHGDLPREHRGHLRRHRVRGRHARRRRRSSTSSPRNSRSHSTRSASAPRRRRRRSGTQVGAKGFPTTSRWASASSPSATPGASG
jgi:hypothetical protein